MTDATEPTVVTQADREAAELTCSIVSARIRRSEFLGLSDEIAKAFASHRLAAEQSRASTPAVGREAILTLDVFLSAYGSLPDDAIVFGDDDLLTFGTLRAILALHPPASDDAIAAKDAEIARLREALDAADYLAELYERLWKGGVVRDLAEAIAARDSTRAKVRAAAPAQPSQAGLPDREVIARIVDPKAWVQRLRHFDQSERCEYADHAEQWRVRADDVVRPSLATADAILASIRSSVGEGEVVVPVSLLAAAVETYEGEWGEANSPAAWPNRMKALALTAISGGPHADAS